jgi:carbonic anhydrase
LWRNKTAIGNIKLGNITTMLEKIKPAIFKSQNFLGEKTSKNDTFVELVSKNNVLNSIQTIRSKSSILKEMEHKGEIKIIGAIYNLKNGVVDFY